MRGHESLDGKRGWRRGPRSRERGAVGLRVIDGHRRALRRARLDPDGPSRGGARRAARADLQRPGAAMAEGPAGAGRDLSGDAPSRPGRRRGGVRADLRRIPAARGAGRGPLGRGAELAVPPICRAAPASGRPARRADVARWRMSHDRRRTAARTRRVRTIRGPAAGSSRRDSASWASWAVAAWGRSTRRGRSSSSGSWRSRCCERMRTRTPARRPGSRPRPRRRPGSSTPISCRSTRWANTRGWVTWCWSTRPAAAWTGVFPSHSRTPGTPRASSRPWRGPFTSPISAASSIATSSRPTSCSPRTASPRSPTSAWPSSWSAMTP